ncbi:MAG: TMEM165/GDT1 family protein [Microcoleus vaginatus WJT46-NPBG5]|nr:TMEM165/GDT1 family protein [Microcoleus vaginatus WJT46-NPBG5]
MKLVSAPSTLPAPEFPVSGLDSPQHLSKRELNDGGEVLPAERSEIKSFQTAERAAKPKTRKGLSVFWSTFITIFLAELGDKTQVTTLLMSAESHSPWLVFAGAGTALVATSLVGVLLGQWLAKRLSPKTLETSAGVSMLLISALLLWDVVR